MTMVGSGDFRRAEVDAALDLVLRRRDALRLAAEFLAVLEADIGRQLGEVWLINEQHRKQGDDSICESGSRCDSNVTMLEAWARVFGSECNVDDPQQMELLNAAWRLALP